VKRRTTVKRAQVAVDAELDKAVPIVLTVRQRMWLEVVRESADKGLLHSPTIHVGACRHRLSGVWSRRMNRGYALSRRSMQEGLWGDPFTRAVESTETLVNLLDEAAMTVGDPYSKPVFHAVSRVQQHAIAVCDAARRALQECK